MIEVKIVDNKVIGKKYIEKDWIYEITDMTEHKNLANVSTYNVTVKCSNTHYSTTNYQQIDITKGKTLSIQNGRLSLEDVLFKRVEKLFATR